jgi:hypothetical protein
MMIRGTGAQGTAKSQSDVDELTWRVRVALAAELVTERRMFGGTTFMLNGNMLCWAGRSGLMVRVGREGEAAALTAPFTGPCLETGRPMGGFVMVKHLGIAEDASLAHWLDFARAYVTALPAKAGARARTRRLKRRQRL